MRTRTAKKLSNDSEKLVTLSLALSASGSRVEDRFWETQIDAVIAKVMRQGSQASFEAALEHLQQAASEAFGALADLIETQSESFTATFEGQSWDVLLIAAPILAWTRYAIASGPIKADAHAALSAHMQAHVLAANVRFGLVPALYSIDHLPPDHVKTYQLTQQLAQKVFASSEGTRTLAGAAGKMGEATPVLADPRFLLAIVAVPAGGALFRWQEGELNRDACLDLWRAQARATLASILPGCEFECLLPDAYHCACRDADEGIRAYTIRTAVRYLEDTLRTEAGELRAVIGGFGEETVEEYRISFTRRGSNEVLYGVVWPLFGRELGEARDGIDEGAHGVISSPAEEIVSLLRAAGVTEIRRHPSRFDPEYCDDCQAPLYADPLAELVHAEMPEDVEPSQSHFH